MYIYMQFGCLCLFSGHIVFLKFIINQYTNIYIILNQLLYTGKFYLLKFINMGVANDWNVCTCKEMLTDYYNKGGLLVTILWFVLVHCHEK